MDDVSLMLNLFLYSYMLLFGLLVGSFLNVVALRLTNNQSLIKPRSHCPHCKTQLTVRELIPLFSFIMQKGRCRHCQQRLSPLYPLGEALTAGLYVLLLHQVGIELELLIGLVFVSVLVVAVISDLATSLIPFRVVVPAIVFVLLLRVWTHGPDVWRFVAAAVITFAIFFLIDWTYRKWKHTDDFAFGGGDVMIFLLVAVTIGLFLTLLTLFLSSLFGLMLNRLGIGRDQHQERAAVRLAPAILLAAIISYLWGESILHFYFEHFLSFSFFATHPIK